MSALEPTPVVLEDWLERAIIAIDRLTPLRNSTPIRHIAMQVVGAVHYISSRRKAYRRPVKPHRYWALDCQ